MRFASLNCSHLFPTCDSLDRLTASFMLRFLSRLFLARVYHAECGFAELQTGTKQVTPFSSLGNTFFGWNFSYRPFGFSGYGYCSYNTPAQRRMLELADSLFMLRRVCGLRFSHEESLGFVGCRNLQFHATWIYWRPKSSFPPLGLSRDMEIFRPMEPPPFRLLPRVSKALRYFL